ncbi:hypothetical protein K435DRAFT_567064, partial [Dendrothele bispora CBS 962.96]
FSCFPHVINIAVKTGLTRLHVIEFDENDMDALERDLISGVRQLVNACRASGKRREALRKIIIDMRIQAQEERQANGQQMDESEEILTRVVVLPRDVDTQWSSFFLMVDRLLGLYPAVKEFALQPGNEEIKSLLLSDWELIRRPSSSIVLQCFHLVQELVSAEKTPTLAVFLPLYERLISNLKKL